MGGVPVAGNGTTAPLFQRYVTPSTGSSSASTLCCVCTALRASYLGRKQTDPFHSVFVCCGQLLAGVCYRTYFWTIRTRTVHNKQRRLDKARPSFQQSQGSPSTAERTQTHRMQGQVCRSCIRCSYPCTFHCSSPQWQSQGFSLNAEF